MIRDSCAMGGRGECKSDVGSRVVVLAFVEDHAVFDTVDQLEAWLGFGSGLRWLRWLRWLKLKCVVASGS